ncbi:hypothetical protein SAMN05518672_103213 [Chitinophaga sp. CF118]|uniref:hypothetical protein n=1 Tax=Chitinophaga sp. CF118 TaxID=1884367 RepID=UPI0008DF4EA7|nr:hypothetical protein [Chitinophaga sp. CF118]SFD78647.1 hypothetical protein SAMN05518672_103213 [Chitinophaga sp. CF118]
MLVDPRYTLSLLPLLLFYCIGKAYAREDPEYDEIPVQLIVQNIGGIEIPALIREDSIYLPVADIFDFLKIRNTLSAGLDSLSGFFISQQAVFLIDKTNNKIQYQGKSFVLPLNTLIHTPGGLFLKSDYFQKVFGLLCVFSFRNLSVTLSTNIELPAIREMRQKMMRLNISRLKGETKADTAIGRNYPLFHIGMADWSIIATQRISGTSDTRINLALGGIIAGGETNVSLNYNYSSEKQQAFSHDSSLIKPFDERQQYYRWRYANNDHRALRQVIAGKIFAQSTSSLYAPVVGVQITNTPTTCRRSFGTYTLSNFTEPGWIVELYVNNSLVDYTNADASGFFTFQVPMVYGNSLVKLRFYGPWGEERSREENISIPFNFLPKHEFEYTASAGIVQDGHNSQFSRIQMNYGASRKITVGGGLEYLSSVTTGKNMPFVNASVRVLPSLLFSGDYTYNVKARAIITYRVPSNLEVELNYTRYKKGQLAINYNYLEERRITISRPFNSRHFSAFSRLVLNQILLPDTKYTTAEWLLSGGIYGVGTNLTTYAMFTEQASLYIYSNLSLSFRLPGKVLFNPQLQYGYNDNKPIALKCELGKYVFHRAYVNISYEQNFKSRITNIGIGFRYDLPFAQTGLSSWRNNNISTAVQSVRGSLIYNNKPKYLGANNRISVGTGGVVLLPYLDLNCNGQKDPDEPRVAGLKAAINSGRITNNNRDTLINITDIEPYTNYHIELNPNSFDNIAWQIKKKSFNVAIDANRLKLVEVPVTVMGEVSGKVYVNREGQGRILVGIYNNDSIQVARILTESDGFFNYMGLAPGTYTARMDPSQLHKLRLTASPAIIPFQIIRNKDGDIVDGLEFHLQAL